MIVEFLVVLIVALIIANILAALIKPKKRQQPFAYDAGSYETAETPEVVETNELALDAFDEKHALLSGSVTAANQKISSMAERLSTVEKAVADLIEQKLALQGTTNESTQKELDYEKLDFRLKVLEGEIDNIKNPRPKTKTFYGKQEDPMEKEIKALVFNTKKKDSPQ